MADPVTYDPRLVDRFDAIVGDSAKVLTSFPSQSIDCVITSPPYWGQRIYANSTGIGQEADFPGYLDNLLSVLRETKRILKDDGSLWLNMGDRYRNKNLMGMPWRVALALKDDGWVLRQESSGTRYA